MGMFDYIKCELMLPDASMQGEREFQTKSLENVMVTYVITAKGELYKEQWDYEWVNDDNHFFKGYSKRVDGSYRRNYLTDYHGDIMFYNSSTDGKKWRDYYARFTDGRLTRMWYEDI